jgi:DNA-nicking Smr family endonuclease
VSPPPPKRRTRAQSLDGLDALLEALRQQRQAALAQAAAERAAAERAALERDLFRRWVGPVQALSHPARVHPTRPRPAPTARQQMRDEAEVMREALSDDFDVSSLLETDDQLSYRRVGIGTDVLRRLRRGDWAVQRELDLHGLRTDDARAQLAEFIRACVRQGLRCVRIVHGKGLGSPGKTPVLKSRVHSWLVQKREVLAFVQARPAEGGAGALIVLLRGQR